MTPNTGIGFGETITAVDSYANTAETYVGPQTVTWSAAPGGPGSIAPSYPASVTFTGGVGTAAITLFDSGTTMLTAVQGTLSGTSDTFTVTTPTQPDPETSSFMVRMHHGRTQKLMATLGTQVAVPIRQVLAQTL